jgi:endo-1,4-beta-xylanase
MNMPQVPVSPVTKSEEASEKSAEQVLLEQCEANIQETRRTTVILNGYEPNESYKVTMGRHDFPFGTAVDFVPTTLFNREELWQLFPTYKDIIDARLAAPFPFEYLDVARESFSGMVPESVLKWTALYPHDNTPNWYAADKVMEYVKQDPLVLKNFRGHTLFWNKRSANTLPPFLLNASSEEIQGFAMNHTVQILKRYPEISEWDIINEPLVPPRADETGSVIMNPEAPETMEFYVNLIKTAHEIAPNTRFYINEFDILTGRVDKDGIPKIDKFVNFVSSLKGKLEEQGIPTQNIGVGLQGHFWDTAVPTITELNERLERIAELGLDIKITEFDVPSTYFDGGETARAEWISKALTVFYGNPSVTGIYVWGFYNNWRGSACDLMQSVNGELQLTEAGHAYMQKVYSDWSTETVVQSDADGNIGFTGFPGEYSVAKIED